MESYHFDSNLLLTSVSVVCRSSPPIAGLSHVVYSLDAFLDPSATWTISDGCRFGSVRLLDRIAARIASNEETIHKPEELQQDFHNNVTVAMTWGRVEVVKWLIRRFPSGQVRSNAVAQAAKNGHLQVLQWLFNHHDHVFWGGDEMYFAVGNNRLQVAKFLHEYTTPPSDDRFLIDEAARHGDLDMMQWLHTERGDRLTYEGVTRAVDCGFLEAVKWMKDTFPRDVRINEIKMDNAAANGHLDMVKWLHTQQAWCTKQAMNRAASNGHVEIVKFLHENRSEGCTTDAMDLAAANGHLNMVKWLHENRTEGCTQYAVDTAAKKGYLYVMKWLYANRHEGCSRDAMDSAAAGGRLEIVQWLHAHYAVGCSRTAFADAIANGHLEIAKWLGQTFPDMFGM